MFDRSQQPAHRTPPQHMPGTHVPEARARARTEKEILEEILEETRAHRLMSTDIRGLHTQTMNGVLAVELIDLSVENGGAGYAVRGYGATVGSIIVLNYTSSNLMVGPGAAGNVGSRGIGVSLVPAGTWLGIPIAQRHFSITGSTTGMVGIQAFQGLQAIGGSGALL